MCNNDEVLTDNHEQHYYMYLYLYQPLCFTYLEIQAIQTATFMIYQFQRLIIYIYLFKNFGIQQDFKIKQYKIIIIDS